MIVKNIRHIRTCLVSNFQQRSLHYIIYFLGKQYISNCRAYLQVVDYENLKYFPVSSILLVRNNNHLFTKECGEGSQFNQETAFHCESATPHSSQADSGLNRVCPHMTWLHRTGQDVTSHHGVPSPLYTQIEFLEEDHVR